MAEDLIYVERAGDPLLARVYRAVGSAPAPVVVDLHGGAWNAGDRTYGGLYGSHLAEHGITVVATDFRQGPVHQHPASSEDLVAALNWIASSADALGIDPARAGVMGSSSGGHLALLGAVLPSAFGEAAVRVRAVAALWPPVDPLERHRFAQRQLETVTDDRLRQLYAALAKASPSYFGSEEVMAAASIAHIVRAGDAEALPPLYVARAGKDTNVPVEMLDELATAWRAAGGDLTLSEFPDEPHAFGHMPGPATDRLLNELVAFFTTNLEVLP